MSNNFVKYNFDTTVKVEHIITIFYMEMSKDFHYEGERHDFWEMVYIDKGEMLCTAEKSQFVLKSGELTFHKPNEFHNLSGNNSVVPNVSILTFDCHSPMMEFFDGKIFRLNAEERQLLAMLFQEGLSCFKLEDPENPLLQRVQRVENAPFGSQQMTKNLLEVFLIKLHRHTESTPTENRLNVEVNGIAVPMDVKEILDVLEGHLYDRLTVGEIARLLGKSESTIKERFALYRSGGIIHHYNYLKIKEAKRLIREGRYNLAQIADLLRFDTPQYFSKCFKDYTRMTPSEYKRSIMR